jgi:hypothetical protein
MTELPIQAYANYQINDTLPDKEEIIQALLKLRTWNAPGALGISVQDLKKLHHKARLSEEKCEQDIQLWEKIVKLITSFESGQVPQAFYNGVLVLIPKRARQNFGNRIIRNGIQVGVNDCTSTSDFDNSTE